MSEPEILSQQGFLWKRQGATKEIVDQFPAASIRNPSISAKTPIACRAALADIMPGAFLVKSTLFTKSKKRSWALGWHQDRSVPVAEKHAASGYMNWTRKAGQWHVEPPEDVLEKMLFIQIYLDPVGPLNGPTELAVGSHKYGRLDRFQIDDVIGGSDTHLCIAKPGDMLICKALLLHRSLPSKTTKSRRILRLDFANFDLPAPLEWAQ